MAIIKDSFEKNNSNKNISKSNIVNSDFESKDPLDGREPFQWISRWPSEARKEIRYETYGLFFLFILSLFLLFSTWQQWFSVWFSLSTEQSFTFRKYAYYATSGMLGGITFGMKYFYRAVARGWWHQDRRVWRFMSPFVAMIIALIVGMLIDTNVISAQNPNATSTSIAVGFLAGYFADEAVGKMYEIASVLFGNSVKKKGGDGK